MPNASSPGARRLTLDEVWKALISPEDPFDFSQTYQSRGPVFFQEGRNQRLNALVAGGEFTMEHLLELYDVSPPSENYLTQGVPNLNEYRELSPETARTLIEVGAPVTMQITCEVNHPDFFAIGSGLRHGMRLPANSGGYLIYGNRENKGYKLHYDPGYVCQLSLVGEKRWRVSKGPIRQWPDDRATDQALTPEDMEAAEWIEIDTKPGDFLFIPPGHAHATTTSGPTLGMTYHITYRRQGESLFNALGFLVSDFLDQTEDPRWLAPVPPTWSIGSRDELTAAWQAFSRSVEATLRQADPDELRSQINRILATSALTLKEGGDPSTLNPDSLLVKSRRGFVSSVVAEDGSEVTFHYGVQRYVFDQDDGPFLEIARQIANREQFVAKECMAWTQGIDLPWEGVHGILSTLVQGGVLTIEEGPGT